MPENKDTTHGKLGNLKHTKRSTNNTLGMSKEEYEKYQKDIVNEYVNDDRWSLRALSRREKEDGVQLHPDRLRRWIISAGHSIRSAEVARRKSSSGGESRTFYLRKDQLDVVDKFDNASEIVRMGLDVAFGIPTRNAILFLDEYKNVIFLDKLNKIEAFTTSDLTDTEGKIVQTVLNKANLHGIGYVARFAIENELNYYGANAEDDSNETE
ncbi:hypothetical protein ACKGJO_06890 [Gracilimonas sp. Q87]|uniref:hypothetical protein n=1 Tax=Gracilimonas sp. Q87 TaxID=3384766 RepID=UPI0039842B80